MSLALVYTDLNNVESIFFYSKSTTKEKDLLKFT